MYPYPGRCTLVPPKPCNPYGVLSKPCTMYPKLGTMCTQYLSSTLVGYSTFVVRSLVKVHGFECTGYIYMVSSLGYRVHGFESAG